MFYIPYTVGWFRLMLHMRAGLVLPYIQLGAGLVTSVVPLYANVIWLAAAYRPEQDPQNVRMLVDLGWMAMDMTFAMTIPQYLAILLVILRDRRIPRLIPTWFGWLGAVMSVEFLLELIMPFFRSGPFGWSGIFNYWIPFFLPFAWYLMSIPLMISASRRLTFEPESSHTSLGYEGSAVDPV